MNTVKTQALKVLVADDDRLVLAGIGQGLEQAGYAVLTAESGMQAVQAAAERMPDLIVMDVRMPGVSGIDAARIIREASDIPVLFLSAYDEEDAVKNAIAQGGMSYLVKPVRINQLLTAIEAAMARAADIKRLRTSEANLTAALKGDRNIGIATGILMERLRLTAADAFETLRGSARSQQRKLAEVAAEIVAACETSSLRKPRK